MDVAYFAVIAAGLGAWWWRAVRPLRVRTLDRSRLDDDATIALHVAEHEAQQRQQLPTSLDLLYGLLQLERVATAIGELGGDASTLEDEIASAIELHAGEVADDNRIVGVLATRDAYQIVYIAAIMAQHHGRIAGCVDLWAYLAGSEAAALVDRRAASKAGHTAVLFKLLHGTEPDVSALSGPDVFVVLRNDDFTTQETVCEILREVFGLSAVDANARMLATHHEGRALVGRFDAISARTKIAAARDIARGRGYPLWIGIEPT